MGWVKFSKDLKSRDFFWQCGRDFHWKNQSLLGNLAIPFSSQTHLGEARKLNFKMDRMGEQRWSDSCKHLYTYNNVKGSNRKSPQNFAYWICSNWYLLFFLWGLAGGKMELTPVFNIKYGWWFQTSFGFMLLGEIIQFPEDPCMVYSLTFGWFLW